MNDPFGKGGKTWRGSDDIPLPHAAGNLPWPYPAIRLAGLTIDPECAETAGHVPASGALSI